MDIDAAAAGQTLAAAGDSASQGLENAIFPVDEPERRTSKKPRAAAGAQEAADLVPERTIEGARAIILDAQKLVAKDIGAPQRTEVWVKEASELLAKAVLPPTIIAVVGNTGAGKSATLNALLGEEIMPTAGHGEACTAAVIELSYCKAPGEYSAEIEFMTETEWRTEIKLSLDDLVAEDGTIRTHNDSTSPAGIADSKLRAVFPHVPREKWSMELLTSDRTVAAVLGKTSAVRAVNGQSLAEQIRKYVMPDTKKRTQEMWPLVKKVSLYGPWEVLKTGVKLGDLPGVADGGLRSRAAVSGRYLKNANNIFVCADITRAKDEKVAHDLLGESFRRQLLMDASYGSVAFVCTKTDIMVVSDIMRALGLDQDVKELLDEIEKLDEKKAMVEADCARNKEDREPLEILLQNRLQEIRSLERRQGAGKASGPAHVALRASKGTGRKKRRAASPDKDDDEVVIFSSSDSDSEFDRRSCASLDEEIIVVDSDTEQDGKGGLDADEIKKQIEEAQAVVDALRASLADLSTLADQLNKKFEGYERRKNKKLRVVRNMCAKARNANLKEQMKNDFVAGLMDLQADLGIQPDNRKEMDVPIFTVSSADYLKLIGKRKTDGDPTAFKNPEETEIPALHRYILQLTEQGRKKGSEDVALLLRRFFASVESYLADDSSSDLNLQDVVKTSFYGSLPFFKTALGGLCEDFLTRNANALTDVIGAKLHTGARVAKDGAVRSIERYNAPYIRNSPAPTQDRGLHYSTYKATVRRDGVYSSRAAGGTIDMNQRLADPIQSQVTSTWDRVLNNEMVVELDALHRNLLSAMDKNVGSLASLFKGKGASAARVDAVANESMELERIKIPDSIDGVKAYILETQREISRALVPEIAESMKHAYASAAAEYGKGSLQRMRELMVDHVEENRHEMFDEAVNVVLDLLRDLSTNVKSRINALQNNIIERLTHAFSSFWELSSSGRGEHIRLKMKLLPDITRLMDRADDLLRSANLPVPERAPRAAVQSAAAIFKSEANV
ncbi:hypothetical protein DFJ74DRAFT_728651 [Hyaloraphidium curvatum]|nr:hypothetical protein DFJ74DRAFT_728651 [Hyaloraphidium curvatum]